MNGESTEVTSVDEAQMTLQYVIGSVDDVDDYIDDGEYSKALEELDEAIEKLQSVRVYISSKVTS